MARTTPPLSPVARSGRKPGFARFSRGGAELGRIFDPFNWGIGIARDLGVNRRPIAEALAQKIPTLGIAGDLDGGSDGVVTIGATQFNYCQWRCFPGIFHPDLRFDFRVINAIKEFWQSPGISPPDRGLEQQLISYLRSIPGVIDGHFRDYYRAKVSYRFSQGITLKEWHNPLGLYHVYLGNAQDQCIYAGYGGGLKRSMGEIPDKFSSFIVRN